jgi:hypothetical protein
VTQGILQCERFDLAAFEAAPTFSWREPNDAGTRAMGLLSVLVFGILLGLVAFRKRPLFG